MNIVEPIRKKNDLKRIEKVLKKSKFEGFINFYHWNKLWIKNF